MGYVNSYYCYMAVSSYKDKLDLLKAEMWKNYQEMDLSNASIQSDIEDVVDFFWYDIVPIAETDYDDYIF